MTLARATAETPMNGEMPHILIVDDDPELRELLGDTLAAYGIGSFAVESGAAMFRELERRRYDLILLDIMLPGEDGLELCRRLRAPESPSFAVPIIFLSALRDTADRVLGLEMGGDDYLSKPFQPRELVARIRALLRRATTLAPAPEAAGARERGLGKDTVWAIGPWKLHALARHLVDIQGVVVALSSAEFRLLTLFLEHPRQEVTREQILDHMTGRGTDIFDRSIDAQISRLRTKLRDNSRNPQIIRTLRGDGYMLIADIAREDA